MPILIYLRVYFSDTLIYDLDRSVLGCGFPLWKTIVLSTAGGIFIIILACIVFWKWTTIKFYYHSRFTKDDDGLDPYSMTYDVFLSYR